MSYYQISFPCLAENLCHIKLPLKFYDDSSSYLVSHYIRSTNGEDDEVAADNEIHNLTDILEKNNVPYELSNRGMAVDARSNFRTFFYPHFPKGSNGTLKMTVDYYDYESNPSSIEEEAKKYVEENRREDEFYHGFDPTEFVGLHQVSSTTCPQDAETRANEHLRHLIPPDVLQAKLSQNYCEIESDFLCFALPYEAIAETVPRSFPIIDFGCYMAPQAYFFQYHAAYIGVDCYEFSPIFAHLERFQPSNCHHIISKIQDCAAELHDKYPDAYAICNAVPDVAAWELVSRLFANHCITYPDQKSDISGIGKSKIAMLLRDGI